MRLRQLLIVVLGLFLTASSCPAEYSLAAATGAAGKLMPKDGPEEFSLLKT